MINVVTDNDTGLAVFASSYYSLKQLRLKWGVGYAVTSVVYDKVEEMK